MIFGLNLHELKPMVHGWWWSSSTAAAADQHQHQYCSPLKCTAAVPYYSILWLYTPPVALGWVSFAFAFANLPQQSQLYLLISVLYSNYVHSVLLFFLFIFWLFFIQSECAFNVQNIRKSSQEQTTFLCLECGCINQKSTS